jgi:FkbM family methyltransferase
MFIDIGANIGIYSLVAATSRSSVSVVAFEPDPASADLLRENIRLNSVDVRVIEAAISSTAGFAVLHVPHGHSGMASLRSRGLKQVDEVNVRTVAVDELDGAIAVESGSAIDVVIKIDVEGHEFEVLKTLSLWKAWQSVSAIWVEFSPLTDVGSCEQLLLAAGFLRVLYVGTTEHSDVLFVKPGTRLPARVRGARHAYRTADYASTYKETR